MNEREGLAPCPFCGGKAEIERYGNSRQSTIYACTDCGCRLETGEGGNYGMRWNTRAPAPSAWQSAAFRAPRWPMAISDASLVTSQDRETP